MCACGDQRVTGGILPSSSTLYFLRQGFSLNLYLVGLANCLSDFSIAEVNTMTKTTHERKHLIWAYSFRVYDGKAKAWWQESHILISRQKAGGREGRWCQSFETSKSTFSDTPLPRSYFLTLSRQIQLLGAIFTYMSLWDPFSFELSCSTPYTLQICGHIIMQNVFSPISKVSILFTDSILFKRAKSKVCEIQTIS